MSSAELVSSSGITEWVQDYTDDTEGIDVVEYDITAVPNDFNVLTIFNFIESGAVVIPGFQRNFIWDIKRASRLIESLILGLPVPQIFLYEENRNRFLVIDGQQRLMSIYYFMKQRFPVKEKRVELRTIFDKYGRIPDEVLQDDKFFGKFNLYLPERLPDRKNRYDGLNYATLGESRNHLDLRPIRNVIVKQNAPPEDDSSIYEIFSRLNSGGVNLTPQEIRASLYHSEFFDTLRRLNTLPEWRRFLPSADPDLHMKDIEILLRAFAMLIASNEYAPSLTKFLNEFSTRSRSNSAEQNAYLEELFRSFLQSAENLPVETFLNKRNRRFNVALFEAVFTAACEDALSKARRTAGSLSYEGITSLEKHPKFIAASIQGTTKTANVQTRLALARRMVTAL